MEGKVSATARVRLNIPLAGGEAQVTVVGESCEEVLRLLRECAGGAVGVAAEPLGVLLRRAADFVKSRVWVAVRKYLGFRGS